MIILVLTSCKKTELSDNERQKEILIDEIFNIVALKVQPESENDLLLSNCNNPYDFVGEITGRMTSKILSVGIDKKTDPDSLRTEFLNSLNENLSVTYLQTDTSDIDPIEKTIEEYLIGIYINEGFEIFLIKSKDIEDIVFNANFLSENQRKRILIFSSIIRQEVGALKSLFDNNGTKKESEWEKCFDKKLEELFDCKSCFFEKLYCTFTWVTCLGLKALDCGIQVIF
jgi:hypothetical protein